MRSSKQAILFVGAGRETVPGIKLAKDMGLHVVVSDANINAPGMQLADDTLIASTYDVEETLAVVESYVDKGNSINGVICVGTDVPITVASVASFLCAPGITLASASLASNKLEMKRRFNQEGVSTPKFGLLMNFEQLETAFKNSSGELVIKPIDSRGARGVLRINNRVDTKWAFEKAKSQSRSGQVMVEEFLEGPQFSTESIVIDGEVHTLGYSNRNYEFLDKYFPYIIENGGDLPADLSDLSKVQLNAQIARAAKALGVHNGVVKGDIVLHKNEPYIIEMAARLSGGYFCTHEIPLNTGVNFVRLAILQCLGMEISADDLAPKRNVPVAQRYFFPDAGKVISISVPPWVGTDPEIALFEIRVSVGDVIQEITNHTSRAGLVITTSNNQTDAIAKANRVVSEVKIVTTRVD